MSISPAEYQRRLQSILSLSKLQDMAFQVIVKDEMPLLKMKRDEYTIGSIYSNEQRVPYAGKSYSAYKYSLNPSAHGLVDLILSGDFVEAMYVVRISGNRYKFANTDWKSTLLEGKYGAEIYGLNQESFDLYQKNVLADQYVRLIKDTAKIA